jgi:uncharacterized protein
MKLIALFLTLALAFPVSAQTFKAQPLPKDAQHQWQTAPTIKGALGWDVLMKTKEKEKKIDGAWYITPEFAKEVKPFDGKIVKINGYMLPLKPSETQSEFVLMAYPPDCPFCLTAGSQAWMLIKAKTPLKYKREPMLLEGRLELVAFDPEGTFYKLHDARRVN